MCCKKKDASGLFCFWGRVNNYSMSSSPSPSGEGQGTWNIFFLLINVAEHHMLSYFVLAKYHTPAELGWIILSMKQPYWLTHEFSASHMLP